MTNMYEQLFHFPLEEHQSVLFFFSCQIGKYEHALREVSQKLSRDTFNHVTTVFPEGAGSHVIKIPSIFPFHIQEILVILLH